MGDVFLAWDISHQWRDELAQIGQVPDVRLELCIGRPAVRAGASVASVHWVAVEQVALDCPAAAGTAFLLPGLMNGYGLIREELAELRVEGIEAKLNRVLSKKRTTQDC